jgi:hypothetical protein
MIAKSRKCKKSHKRGLHYQPTEEDENTRRLGDKQWLPR